MEIYTVYLVIFVLVGKYNLLHLCTYNTCCNYNGRFIFIQSVVMIIEMLLICFEHSNLWFYLKHNVIYLVKFGMIYMILNFHVFEKIFWNRNYHTVSLTVCLRYGFQNKKYKYFFSNVIFIVIHNITQNIHLLVLLCFFEVYFVLYQHLQLFHIFKHILRYS